MTLKKRFPKPPRILLQLFLLGIVLLFLGGSAKASHHRGADVSYTCINPCTTRVSLTIYGDCTVSCYFGQWVRWKERTPGCLFPPALNTVVNVWQYETTPVCPGQPTRCNTIGAMLAGVEEWKWSRDYDICAVPACEFDLIWTDCCRGVGVQNINSPGSAGIALVDAFINTGLGGCNNSPQFTDPGLSYFCAGQDHEFAIGAYDPDGDSLAYALVPCYADSVNPVSYAVGYSFLQPLGPTWNVSLDGKTGILKLNAVPGSNIVAEFAVRIDEYRNGIRIGSVFRDMHLIGMACGSNVTPTFQPFTNVTGATSVVGMGRCDLPLYPGNICLELRTADPNARPKHQNHLGSTPCRSNFARCQQLKYFGYSGRNKCQSAGGSDLF